MNADFASRFLFIAGPIAVLLAVVLGYSASLELRGTGSVTAVAAAGGIILACCGPPAFVFALFYNAGR